MADQGSNDDDEQRRQEEEERRQKEHQRQEREIQRQDTELYAIIKAVGATGVKVGDLDYQVINDNWETFVGATVAARNTWVLWKVYNYRKVPPTVVCNEFLGYFQEDFEGWTADGFRDVKLGARRALKQALHVRGIWTSKTGGPINQRLEELVTAEEIPEWNEKELEETQAANPDSVAWRVLAKIQERRKRSKPTTPQLQPNAPLTAEQELEEEQEEGGAEEMVECDIEYPTLLSPVAKEIREKKGENEALRIQQQQQGRANTPSQAESVRVTPVETRATSHDKRAASHKTSVISHDIHVNSHGQWNGDEASTDYMRLPPAEHPNELCPSTAAAHFSKLWDREFCYTGERYDILDDKVRFFLDACFMAGLRQGQLHFVFPLALSGRARVFFLHQIDRGSTFAQMYKRLKSHFDTETNQAKYLTDWSTTTFDKTKRDNPTKSDEEALEAMLERLQTCQRALGADFSGEKHLIVNVMRACRGVRELEYALQATYTSFEDLAAKLRMSLQVHNDRTTVSGINYADRRFNRRDRGDNYGRDNQKKTKTWKGKCYVCGKEGCRAMKHTPEEQKEAKDRWLQQRRINGGKGRYGAFLTQYEEEDGDESEDESEDDPVESGEDDQFVTAAYLCNEAFKHRLLPTVANQGNENGVFTLDKYADQEFQGIMPDTGAARVSTAGKDQFLALQRALPTLELDRSRQGEATIRFGGGKLVESVGTVDLEMPVGTASFHVLDTPTPFLLSLGDMDRLGIYLNNLENALVRTSDGKKVPVVRRWGHPWFFLDSDQRAKTAYLTEAEIRRVHTRFGHPSVAKLHALLTRAGHNDVERSAIKAINKFCHHCQVKGSAPKRFKFALRKDIDFNYEIIVDVMYLVKRPVLHVVDAATAFQAGRFLRSMSAKDAWEALRECWIDTYLGPPDVVTHDAGTNFDSAHFRAETKLLGITAHQIPVEAHWSIGKVEEYHAPVRRAFEIIIAEARGTISEEAALQMAFKAVNDTAGPDGLVPTLLVFGAYPRITADSPPSSEQQQRARAIHKAMNELQRLRTQRQVRDALNTRNGPNTVATLPMSLPLGSEVLVYREKEGWTGPYKTIATTEKDVTIEMENGATTFRSTHVKPYNKRTDNDNTAREPAANPAYPERTAKRRRGRPRKNAQPEEQDDGDDADDAFLSHKEKAEYKLALELRTAGKITTPGKPFERSDATEIDGLMAAGVIQPVKYEPNDAHRGIRLFKSRMVREIKNKTSAPYEKSRLVVQGYNDAEKTALLTQSPTIQRCSQRLILALAPTLRKRGMELMLRDITQAYTQSKTELNRTVLASLPVEIKERYPEGTILLVVKPLYGLAEAGMHWFATYADHHKKSLQMETSSFDPCLLVTTQGTDFGMTGLQTDDTLNVGTTAFLEKEQTELENAELKAKPRAILTDGSTGDFNGCRLRVETTSITVFQKGQAEKLALIDAKAADAKQQYVEQRARGAYIASICQPEATFDYSVAAQARDPTEDDFKALNKRIQWQMDNKDRGITFCELDLQTTRLFVFVDGSFANNADLSSQIGYVVVYGNETAREDAFTVNGNLIHWSSTKCKRVTRSVLASEIYGMTGGFDLGFVLAKTLESVAARLATPAPPLVLCTDSYSLYQCLVQLGSTTEKRLMIDIMALRQAYEAREISEIRWIKGDDNPADAMTKATPNRALENLVSTNRVDVRLEGWVQREGDKPQRQSSRDNEIQPLEPARLNVVEYDSSTAEPCGVEHGMVF